MESETIMAFLAMGSIIFIGFFGHAMFTRFRIPDVLVLIFLGMLIGPDLLGERFGLVTYETLDAIDRFRSVFLSAALVIILFDGGLSLDLRSVFESMRLSAFMSVLTFLMTLLSIAAAMHFIMGMDVMLALTLGSIVGGTSGAIVIPIANKLRIRPQTKAVMILESAITDVLVVVAVITFLSVIQLRDVHILTLPAEIAIQFSVGAAAGFGGGVAWLFILQRLENQPFSYMITIAALFTIAGLVELVGSSGAVAALAFGLSLGNRQFVKRTLTSTTLKVAQDSHIQQFDSEITFFVRTFFFVYLGLIFRLHSFSETQLVAGLLLISMISLVRWLTSLAAWRLGELPQPDAVALFGMMPRGLAAAVLATFPATVLSGHPSWSEELGALFLNTTLVVILGTTVITTVFSFAAEKLVDRKRRIAIRRSLAIGSEGPGRSP